MHDFANSLGVIKRQGQERLLFPAEITPLPFRMCQALSFLAVEILSGGMSCACRRASLCTGQNYGAVLLFSPAPVWLFSIVSLG